ncbi:anaerobic ribonucleoside-triphosphate reductase activating protein [Oscillospiraceae bacterium HV4-5-C5C]|nr:anaerobic ribonucleoside-triphosphate reductase activating protein [Oscillospiraceae bacterium HV4-5-C5C]
MYYAQLRKPDIANGEGIRVSLFVSGCTLRCPECFNQDYQNFCFGKPWTTAEDQLLLDSLADPIIKGLTVLGGEPFQNTEGLLPILTRVRQQFAADRKQACASGLASQDPYASQKNIWIYSGYTFESLLENSQRLSLLKLCDVLVDGPFISALYSPSLSFRGSRNQRLLDVSASLMEGRAVLYRPDHYI